MTDLEKWQKVNSCETVEDLCECIREFADQNTLIIQGRTKSFDANKMSDYCFGYVKGTHDQPRYMTREFGIRQQAMYLKYSEHTQTK